jgi:hypothetical protein
VTGFIRGLFGGKSKKEESAPQVKKDVNSFFLDNDSAKTFGDIDYMRTAKAVTKSFPNGLGEVTEVISSIDKKAVEIEEEKKAKTEDQIKPEAQFRKPDGISSASTNMDMFRKMAKEIKK